MGKGFFEQAIKVAKQAAGQGKQVAKELAARELIRKTWDAQTLQGLLAGKVVITDEMVNSYLEEQAKDQPDSGRLQVHFTEEHLEITADTQSWGQVIIKGRLVSLHHNQHSSVLVIAVIDKQMLTRNCYHGRCHGLASAFYRDCLAHLNLAQACRSKSAAIL